MSGYRYLGSDIESYKDSDDLKTIFEWSIIYNIDVVDCRKFSGKGPYIFDNLYSREEFESVLGIREKGG